MTTLPDFPEPEDRLPPAPAAYPPLKFEPSLVPRLAAAHRALAARQAALAGVTERDPPASLAEIQECARQFNAIRHIETTLLYPLVAHAVAGDAGARGQLVELRLIALMLARRVQRSFDELLQAARAEVLVADAAARVTASLANYSQHALSAAFPLYELIGTQAPAARVA
jgi:hypothetical protein